MIHKIVVGLDKSDLSLKALQQALAFAQGYQAELKLVCVLSGHESDAPQVWSYFNGYPYPGMNSTALESYQTAWNQYVDDSQSWLGQQVSDSKKTYTDTSGSLLYGAPGAKLCEFAETWNADLIIVGSRGFSGISELWMGSVSNYVMHHAPCSVLIVHAGKQTEQTEMSTQPIGSASKTNPQNILQHILVPVDKSDMTGQAIATAVDLAKLHGAEIKLVHVIDEDEYDIPQKPILSDSQYMLQHNGLLLEEYQRNWNKFIDGWWRQLQMKVQDIEHEKIDAICDVMQGRTGPRICEVAKDWQADLIVIGSRGLSGLKELLVGSVSYYVSHRASCSVLVTRSKPSREKSSDISQKSREMALVNS
ncbi:universal stress protein [Leptolyngbya sp. Heron Island J]|uniref:universal stress protein n=1 Tax=Leptolyngbya sp. Heron Island J TaxID=1385935 RepID=UPI0003B9C7E6|nr:universal stress protein [Leptolyngbya sp. Heron Island J]ESA37449.1 universal stress protein [Leptolyngbya sp. Heron Island J]